MHGKCHIGHVDISHINDVQARSGNTSAEMIVFPLRKTRAFARLGTTTFTDHVCSAADASCTHVHIQLVRGSSSERLENQSNVHLSI